MRPDTIVVGGGIVGTSIGYHLAARRQRVLLIDRVGEGRATDAAAGIISAETYAGDREELFQLGIAAAAYYSELLSALAELGESDCGYHRCGMLVVAEAEDEVERFDALLAQIARRQSARALPSEDELRLLGTQEARAMIPELAEMRRALYSLRAARVDGRLLNAALLRAARRRGLQTRVASVSDWIREGDRVRAAVIEGESVFAEQFVVAGGAWSAALAEPLGVALRVAPQRGQLVHLSASNLDTRGWPMIEGFRGHYLVPWNDGRIVAGATRESGSGFDSQPTAAGIREVLDEAVRLVPPLNRGALTEVRVGLRPLAEDGLPILGRLPGLENVVVATGHGAHGLHLGPYTGKRIADLVCGEATPDLVPFSPQRS
ncbi:MAG TPA: FAD-dependent oxidoreductase [Terriglobales bacterium]|nr:FAD-dependent oxidoreductase [Terriglobales bacterium]